MRSPILMKRVFYGDGLQARSLRSVMLTAFQFGAGNFLRLLSSLILTRLLFPDAFGLMALVQVAMTGLFLLSDFGFSAAIVQNERGEDPRYFQTAWTLKVIRGVILSICAALIAAPVARFYDEPMIAQLLPVVGLTAILNGLSSMHLATANRKLLLGRVTALNLTGQVVTLIATVVLAFLLNSVWALVFGALIGSAYFSLASHFVIPGERARFFLEREAAKSLFGFGKFIFFGTVATFLINHGDRAILGKFVPVDVLAIYQIGLLFATIPFMFGSALSSKVIFPLYSRMRETNEPRQRQKLRKSRFALSGILFAVSIVLALCGNSIIQLLYDPRYHSAGPVLVLGSLALLPALLSLTYSQYALAAGHSGRYSMLVVLTALIQITALFGGILFMGIAGALLAPAIASILVYPLLVYLIRPYGGWDPSHDAIFALIGIVSVGLVWMLHGDILKPLFLPI